VLYVLLFRYVLTIGGFLGLAEPDQKGRRVSVMRMIRMFGVICCFLLLGWADTAVAAEGDTYSSVSGFSTNLSTKANDSPHIGATFPIPSDLKEGDEFQVDCVLEAFKNHKGTPRKGVKGNIATFAIKLDVGSGTWEFFGLSPTGGGIPFTTKRDGTAKITVGPITAGAWATDSHPTNDFISAKIGFTNKKRIKETGIVCQIVVGG
jgi:hypothetical protein